MKVGTVIFFTFSKSNSLNSHNRFDASIIDIFWSIVKAFSNAFTKFKKLLKDSKLLINYETKYDDWDIGPGRTHIRRFLNPYIDKFDKIEKINLKMKGNFNEKFKNKFTSWTS